MYVKTKAKKNVKENDIDPKMYLIYNKICKFYNIEKNYQKFLKIDSNKKFPKRIIEWFVSNYSKEYPVNYIIKGVSYDVYSQYKIQLRSFSKDLFDPFKRKQKIIFKMGKIEKETTIGQLNFFKWFIENNIIRFMENDLNYKKVSDHMKKTLENKKKNIKKIVKKNDNFCITHKINLNLSFK